MNAQTIKLIPYWKTDGTFLNPETQVLYVGKLAIVSFKYEFDRMDWNNMHKPNFIDKKWKVTPKIPILRKYTDYYETEQQASDACLIILNYFFKILEEDYITSNK